MKITLVAPLEEQEGPIRIRPEGVKFPASMPLTLGGNFDARMVVGEIHDIRLEDGALVGDVDLTLGWGGIDIVTAHTDFGTVVDKFELLSTFVTQDTTQELSQPAGTVPE